MNHRKFKIALMAMAGLQIGAICPAMAQTELVMRRPLPRDAVTTPGTPTPPVTNPDPSTPDEVVPDPLALCDGQPGSPQPVISDVAWVATGWSAGPMDPANSCVVQKMAYVCQATFTCQAQGQNTSFTSDAPDSVCENYDGNVSYPPQIGDGGGGGGGNGGLPPGICEEPGPRYRVCGAFDESTIAGFGCVIDGYVEFGSACGYPEILLPPDSGPTPM